MGTGPVVNDAASLLRLHHRSELCQLVVERVVVRDRVLERIEWTPAARPFFEKREPWCPQGVLGTHPLSDDDPLAWYVA
jgi:hypothetical protein